MICYVDLEVVIVVVVHNVPVIDSRTFQRIHGNVERRGGRFHVSRHLGGRHSHVFIRQVHGPAFLPWRTHVLVPERPKFRLQFPTRPPELLLADGFLIVSPCRCSGELTDGQQIVFRRFRDGVLKLNFRGNLVGMYAIASRVARCRQRQREWVDRFQW